MNPGRALTASNTTIMRVLQASRTTKLLWVLGITAAAQAGLLMHDPATGPNRLAVGDVLPAFEVERNGATFLLAPAELPACTFVVFFSNSCAASDQIVPVWSVEARSGDHAIIGVAYAGWRETAEFASTHDLQFDVFATGTSRIWDVARTAGVLAYPRLIALGDDGRVAAIGDSRTTLRSLADEAGCRGEPSS